MYRNHRFLLFDNGGSMLSYTFLLRDGWIYPINIKMTTTDAYRIPARYNFVDFDVPITNFKCQKYIPSQTLACKITTHNFVDGQPITIKDRMWVDLSD